MWLLLVYIHDWCPFLYDFWPMGIVDKPILKPFTQESLHLELGVRATQWWLSRNSQSSVFIQEVPLSSPAVTSPPPPTYTFSFESDRGSWMKTDDWLFLVPSLCVCLKQNYSTFIFHFQAMLWMAPLESRWWTR